MPRFQPFVYFNEPCVLKCETRVGKSGTIFDEVHKIALNFEAEKPSPDTISDEDNTIFDEVRTISDEDNTILDEDNTIFDEIGRLYFIYKK